jgi:2-polyprenyl-6-hydroxyphenyl methylase/3-demethylubiquinone-9 3-methyltransferase
MHRLANHPLPSRSELKMNVPLKANRNTTHGQEIKRGVRFEFGANWARFLALVDEERIAQAEASLKSMLAVENLRGKSFLDIGSGSGLFSLAARRLGARVHSFDVDSRSVSCALELRRRYCPGDEQWNIEEGSILDADFIGKLGLFDVVYSWGVLHHTGAMWEALANAKKLVAQNGTLFIALYNDQGRASRRWWAIKKTYVTLPGPLRFLVLVPCFVRLWGPTMLRDLFKLQPFRTWTARKNMRGMSTVRDVVDWVGGFPFEVCKPEDVFEFVKKNGFALRKLRTCAGGIGCNEFVFEKSGNEPGQIA